MHVKENCDHTTPFDCRERIPHANHPNREEEQNRPFLANCLVVTVIININAFLLGETQFMALSLACVGPPSRVEDIKEVGHSWLHPARRLGRPRRSEVVKRQKTKRKGRGRGHEGERLQGAGWHADRR